VGLAAAFAAAERRRGADAARLQLLRDRLIAQVLAAVAGAALTGSPTARLPHHASFLIQGVEAEGILIGLDLAGIAASSGSACTSAAQRPSHVLEAIGVAPRDAAGGLRFSLGRSTDEAAIDYAVATLVQVVERIRTG
jgi:cysteine desulfurase